MSLYRVTAPGFVAGFVVEKGVVTRCAPVLRKHIGRMPERDALAFCRRRWGTLESVPAGALWRGVEIADTFRVVLGPADMAEAKAGAEARQASAVRLGRCPAHDFPEGCDAGRLHLIGAYGEVCLCRYLRVAWKVNAGRYGGLDVADRYEVRTTMKRTGDLKIHLEDAMSRAPHVLVTCDSADETTWLIVGWCYPFEVCRDKYRRPVSKGARDAYWIPWPELHLLADLPR